MSSESAAGGKGSLTILPLRYGNPPGDPNQAPRCGAKSRKSGGCACQAQAMANGRCRAHGGLGTGPHTEESRAKVRAARIKYAGCDAGTRAALLRADELLARGRALRAQLAAGDFRPNPARPPRLRLVGGTEWSGE